MFQKLTDVRKSYISFLCAELNSQNEPYSRDSAERFVLDSGCTEHMVSEHVCLTDVRPITSSVRFGNNGVLKVAHIGKLNTKHIILHDVLMNPRLSRNLISEGKLDEKGCSIHTNHETEKAYDVNGKIIFQGMKQDGLYVWEPVMEQAYLSSINAENNMELWHL